MQTLVNRLGALVAELRDLPHGLETPVAAGLLVADTLRAVGWSDAVIAEAVGVDLGVLEGAAVALV
jgi:hypothetical protein